MITRPQNTLLVDARRTAVSRSFCADRAHEGSRSQCSGNGVETGEGMKELWILTALAGLCIVTGRQSATQTLADEQTVAMQAAVRRGQFELACPSATGTVLSQNLLQPVFYGGMERAEYTIGVAGCGKRAVYISVCQIGSVACFAAGTSGGDVISRFQGGG